MVQYTCPHCGKQLRIPEQYCGQWGACVQCGGRIQVPLVQQPVPFSMAACPVTSIPWPNYAKDIVWNISSEELRQLPCVKVRRLVKGRFAVFFIGAVFLGLALAQMTSGISKTVELQLALFLPLAGAGLWCVFRATLPLLTRNELTLGPDAVRLRQYHPIGTREEE